jgi:uncharacterized repeat protein (TIGR03803 family)
VFELSPSASGWTETILYRFQGGEDGEVPVAGLVLDAAGNLYGGTKLGGPATGGTIFQLAPSSQGWSFKVLCGLYGAPPYNGGLWNSLTPDSSGNLYGTAFWDPDGVGMLFKVVPQGNGWTCTQIYSFRGSGQYGPSQPEGGIVLDANGNIYGTSSYGGRNNAGTIWKIAP